MSDLDLDRLQYMLEGQWPHLRWDTEYRDGKLFIRADTGKGVMVSGYMDNPTVDAGYVFGAKLVEEVTRV